MEQDCSLDCSSCWVHTHLDASEVMIKRNKWRECLVGRPTTVSWKRNNPNKMLKLFQLRRKCSHIQPTASLNIVYLSRHWALLGPFMFNSDVNSLHGHARTTGHVERMHETWTNQILVARALCLDASLTAPNLRQNAGSWTTLQVVDPICRKPFLVESASRDNQPPTLQASAAVFYARSSCWGLLLEFHQVENHWKRGINKKLRKKSTISFFFEAL